MNDANPYASPAPERASDSLAGIPLLERTIDPHTAIVTEGTITQADYFEAQRVHRHSPRLSVFLILGVLVALAGFAATRFFRAGLSLLGYFLATLAAFLLLMLFLSPRLRTRATWRAAHSLREPMRRLITPELLQTITPTANVLLRWSVFYQFRRSDQVVLLYLAENPQMFLIFPRHMFRSDADWERFCALVETALPRG